MASWSQQERSCCSSGTRSPRRVDAGRPARLVQQHQRQQTERFGFVGHQLSQRPGQANRLGAQAGADQLGPGGGRVALVEQQVQHGEHGPGSFRQHVVGRDAEGYAGVADLALGPHQALGHGGFGDQERPRYLGRGQAGQGAQGEGDLGLQGQGRMTAGEHQAQAVVAARPRRPDPRRRRARTAWPPPSAGRRRWPPGACDRWPGCGPRSSARRPGGGARPGGARRSAPG